MSFWCLKFLPKNEQKQVNLRYHSRYHSSKVEFVRSFFGKNVDLKKSFRLCLTFIRVITYEKVIRASEDSTCGSLISLQKKNLSVSTNYQQFYYEEKNISHPIFWMNSEKFKVIRASFTPYVVIANFKVIE